MTWHMHATRALAAAALLAAPTSLLAATAHAAVAAEPTCRTDQMKLSWADSGSATSDKATGKQEAAIVQVQNSGKASCTLSGYADVTLIQGKTSETLRDASKPAPKSVSLAPGKSTQFTLLFLSEKDEPKQALTPDKAVMKLPGSDTSATLPWKWGPVTKQEGATHPGNSVGAIGATLEAERSPAGKEVDCGNGWNNLRVQAVTAMEPKAACSTAQKVSNSYGKAVEAKKSEPITVTVDGTNWKCQEQKREPSPFQQCVSTKDSAEKVNLLS